MTDRNVDGLEMLGNLLTTDHPDALREMLATALHAGDGGRGPTGVWRLVRTALRKSAPPSATATVTGCWRRGWAASS